MRAKTVGEWQKGMLAERWRGVSVGRYGEADQRSRALRVGGARIMGVQGIWRNEGSANVEARAELLLSSFRREIYR